MKKVFVSISFIFAGFTLFAQDGPLHKGNIKLNAGIGLGSYIKVAGGKTTFLPLTVSGEYAINENTTIGPVLGYTSTEDYYYYSSLGSSDTYKLSNLLIGARANYYFDVDPKYDVYAGGFLGYNVVSSSLVSKSSSSVSNSYRYSADIGGFLYGVQVGGRYKFTPNLSAFAELGYGIAILNVGLTFSIGKK